MKRRVTIKDIAAEAGVSLGTVHLALSDKPGVGAVTRERIRQIEAKALRKLRHPSRSEVLRSFLDD